VASGGCFAREGPAEELSAVGYIPLGSARTEREASRLAAWPVGPTPTVVVGRFRWLAFITPALHHGSHNLGELAATDNEQQKDEDDHSLLAAE
jgi:hypothetical protein